MKIREPASARRLYIKLGMTRGALIGLFVLFVLIVFGFWRVENLSRDARQLSRQNRRLIEQAKVNQRHIKVLAVEGAEAHAGACAMIKDLKQREVTLHAQIDSTLLFLRTHPNGIGEITPDLIRSGLDRSRATLGGVTSTRQALERQIHCKPDRNG